MDNELLAFIVALLAAQSSLTTAGGIAEASGNPRAVAIEGQGSPDSISPFVRVTLTDTAATDDSETYDIATQPRAQTLNLLVNVFSTYEPETRKIASILRGLLQHCAISTTSFQGSTWLESVNYYSDNITDPDRVYRAAALRVRCNMEPKP